jgi:hypothetical protein
MLFTRQDAIQVYARFCRAHFRQAAKRTAHRKAQALKERGDVEGHRVWNEVAREIEKQQGQSDRRDH